MVILDGAAIGGSGSLAFNAASGTLLVDAAETYSGGTTIANGSTLEIGAGDAAGSGDITFSGTGNTLRIDGTTMPSNTIVGMAPGNTIDLAGIAYDSTGTGSADLVGNQLQITENGQTYDLILSGIPAGEYFHLAPDQGIGAGTNITESSVACYCRGTLIATTDGERPVETLEIGDDVVTASGAARPIKWIGKRSYGGRFLMGRKDILPICFKAGSLGNDVPRRDLWISPHHAMFFENETGGVLIEAKDVVNGASIVQAEDVDSVEYFHIELETHDVIIAEGAWSETFVDDDSRGMFHNAHEFAERYGVAVAAPVHYCAPRCDGGHQLEAVRHSLAMRAGLRAETRTVGALRGYVDLIETRSIAGWAQNVDHPEAPVCLDIYAAGELIGQVLANSYREDLANAGLGSGRHGFEFTAPAGLALTAASIEVRRSLDGAVLPHSMHSRPSSTTIKVSRRLAS
jgi:hypothetical protein